MPALARRSALGRAAGLPLVASPVGTGPFLPSLVSENEQPPAERGFLSWIGTFL